MPHALMLALRGLDDAGLRREFDKFADKAEGERLSKAGLTSFMRDKGLAHCDAEVERVLERVDKNKDGDIDFGEFRALAQANSDLEKVLQAKHLECILSCYFPRDTTLEDIATMDRAQFSAIVNLSQPAMVQLLVDLAAQLAAVGKAQDGAGGSKFSGELKGGPLEDFYKGVTGVCGPPDADIEKGMREEHTERPDSHVEFSTSNYGVQTTPSKEWALVFEGGSGCAEVEGKESSVIVTGTRGCCKASGLKWLNTGNADPTTLGLKWLAVGDTQPTEGRQLTNSLLADALASKTAAAHPPPLPPPPSSSTSTSPPLPPPPLPRPPPSTTSTSPPPPPNPLTTTPSKEWELVLKQEQQLTKVVDFTKEDLDKFGIADLRSTDFIEACGSFFKPTASTAQILENPRLADALMHKTEFTQQEWDVFGVHGLRMHHFVKSGDSFFRPVGTVAQVDVRVLRPIAHYGDFGEDGRLKWVVDDEIVVGEALTVKFLVKKNSWSDDVREEKKEIAKDTEGEVLEFNAEGAAKIAFREPVSKEHWVSSDQFYRLFPLPNARDTPIQRRVKLARLRRCDVLALVLYTGPMFVLYNALLRSFGFCGAVAADIEFASDEFWAQWKAVDIESWVKSSGHKFTNTIHALASAIKKLQGLAAEEPSTRLYRGLGGLDVAAFVASCGFTDKAFMSTTKDRKIALGYSGVHKGLVGTILCIETSTTNNGAVISEFSQYPGEEETVWNACSFLQHLPGREELVLPPGGGVVRIFHVLVSANSRAETVEELEGRRKRVVVQVLDTLHADVCRAVDAAVKTADFKARLAEERFWAAKKDDFINSIKDESAARVAMYKVLPDGAYAAIEVLGEAVSKGLALPLLANAKLRLWLEDPSLDLQDMGEVGASSYLGLNAAQGRRLAKRRLLLQDSSAAGRIDGVGHIVVEDRLGRMGSPCTATAALALEDCRERRLVTGAGAAALERKDPYTHETPLIAQVQLGEYENVKRLLQAGADPNAATAGGERALLIAAKEGREDLVELLAGFKAEVNVRYAEKNTVLHWASKVGHHAAVQALLKAGADTEAKDSVIEWTSLHYASYSGHLAVVQALVKAGADIEAKENGGETSLHKASARGHPEVVQTLMEGGADVAAKTNRGETALDVAEKYCQDEVKMEEVKTVFARHSLLMAARVGTAEFVAEHIAREGTDLAARDKRGMTALTLACVKLGTESGLAVGRWVRVTVTFTADNIEAKEVPKGSLGKVAQINEEDGSAYIYFEGLDPAQWVFKSNFSNISVVLQEDELKRQVELAELVAMLIAPTQAAGALDEPNDEGATALMHACVAGLCGVVELLVAAGANLDLINKLNKTALDLTLQNPLRIDGDKMAAVVGVLCKHSLRAAAQVGDAELVAEHIAREGADLAARDGCGRTALVVACAHGHEPAAAQLVAPTHAAGALDVVGSDGFSALLWAEERGLDGVAQSLRECGAAAVRRPAFALFRGEAGAVQVDVKERTVTFTGSTATVRSAMRCPLGGKGYYELEILERDSRGYGFATNAFEFVLGPPKAGVGDHHSWCVNGNTQLKWHDLGKEPYECSWQAGDVIGLACDLDKMQMHVSVNGSFAVPNGLVFQLAPDAVGDGLFAAFSGQTGKVRFNLGEADFRHAPPAADCQEYVAFDG
jgi:ankyrin repeat protein